MANTPPPWAAKAPGDGNGTAAPVTPITPIDSGRAPMTIVQLTASNVKKLKAVSIKPNGELVVLSGKNGSGKSSILDSICMALGGKDTFCPEPVRRGEDHAEVVLDLGELVVRRTFTAAGGTSLVVTNPDGSLVHRSPQALLDTLVGKLTFDPLAFSRQEPKQQAETLRRLVGLDTAALDAERKRLYDERTDTNRQAKQAEARIPTEHLGVPSAEVSVAKLLQDSDAARERQNERVRVRKEAADAATAFEAAKKRHEAAQQALAGLTPDEDVRAFASKLAEADDVNRKVRSNLERAKFTAQHAALVEQSRKLSAAIDELDRQRAEQIASAAMPVPGLGFGADGVTLNTLPLEQASAAEQLRVSVAIGLAANPRLRVLLVRDASLLDKDSLALVAQMAQEAQAQVWLEVVEPGERTSVVIEDGSVKA